MKMLEKLFRKIQILLRILILEWLNLNMIIWVLLLMWKIMFQNLEN